MEKKREMKWNLIKAMMRWSVSDRCWRAAAKSECDFERPEGLRFLMNPKTKTKNKKTTVSASVGVCDIIHIVAMG